MATTPIRGFRILDEDWNEFRNLVPDRDMTTVLKTFVRWYIGRPDAALPLPPPHPESESG